MNLMILVLIGIGCAHLVRRFTPQLLGMKDTTLPFRYPVVELLGGLVFGLIGFRLGMGSLQLAWYVLAVFLLAVGSADSYTKYIPTLVCQVGVGLGLLIHALQPRAILELLDQAALLDWIGVAPQGPMAGLCLAGIGAATGFAMIEFVRRIFRPLVNMEVMGSGDALLMLMIGAFLGPKATLYSMFPACLVGILVGGFRLVLYKVPHSAFGPALAAGAMIVLLFHQPLFHSIESFNAFMANLPPKVPLFISLTLVVVLLLMVMRMRRKAQEYERILDEEYAETDKKMKS